MPLLRLTPVTLHSPPTNAREDSVESGMDSPRMQRILEYSFSEYSDLIGNTHLESFRIISCLVYNSTFREVLAKINVAESAHIEKN